MSTHVVILHVREVTLAPIRRVVSGLSLLLGLLWITKLVIEAL